MLLAENRRYGPMRQVERYGPDHRALARWAASCAARVLPLFEKARPRDARPRRAIAHARDFAHGRVGFTMHAVRKTSLAAHAAARAAKDPAARAAARAAGHAVGTLHVPRHAAGAAMYAVVAAAQRGGPTRADRERAWQKRAAPQRLRKVIYRLRGQGSNLRPVG